jgi:hypothetical protein
MPLFGKAAQTQKGKQHIGMLKRLTETFLYKTYLLALDSYRNVYVYNIKASECVPGKDFNLDKKLANEVLQQTNFIELYPGRDGILGITNLRQVMLCKDPLATELAFEHYNSIFSVMNACVSTKHKVACKMVK